MIEGTEKLLKESWELERKAYPGQYHQLSPAFAELPISLSLFPVPALLAGFPSLSSDILVFKKQVLNHFIFRILLI